MERFKDDEYLVSLSNEFNARTIWYASKRVKNNVPFLLELIKSNPKCFIFLDSK